MKINKVAILISLAMLTTAGTVLFFVSKNNEGNIPTQSQFSSVESRNGFVTIPLADISENATWLEYDLNGEKITFFAVRTGSGSIKTAFDACDVCWQAGKGYRQEGNYMTCNNCGLRFAIADLGMENKAPGGCWPRYLPHTLEEDSVVIKT